MTTATLTKPEKHCDSCGNVMPFKRIRKKKQSQKYCDMRCFYAAVSRSKEALATCTSCGEEFAPTRKSGNGFCSMSCRGSHRPEGSDHLTATMTSEQLDALIASQRPTMMIEPGQRLAPKKGWQYVKPDKGDHNADEREYWGGISRDAGWRLHETTEPESIARDQRNAIRNALAELGTGATMEQVVEAACLPTWTVERRLEEMGRTVRA